MKPLDFSNLVD